MAKPKEADARTPDRPWITSAASTEPRAERAAALPEYALTIRRAGKGYLVVGFELGSESRRERVLLRSDGISACEEEIYRRAVRWFSFGEAEWDMRDE